MEYNGLRLMEDLEKKNEIFINIIILYRLKKGLDMMMFDVIEKQL
jgi:hypothetical protein